GVRGERDQHLPDPIVIPTCTRWWFVRIAGGGSVARAAQPWCSLLDNGRGNGDRANGGITIHLAIAG
ncbi:hypothetical protein JYU34_021355, partial [Plutella xylostella]